MEKKKVRNKIIDETYKRYKKSVNMSYSEFLRWSENKLSKLASLDRKPIKRNLLLLSKPKKNWNLRNVKEANKVISYLARAKPIKSNNYIKGTNLTKNEIALRNWAYNSSKKQN